MGNKNGNLKKQMYSITSLPFSLTPKIRLFQWLYTERETWMPGLPTRLLACKINK